MGALRKFPTLHVEGDDSDSRELTPKQDAFAHEYVACSNKGVAYRKVYNVAETTRDNVVWVNASRLAAIPHVKARILELNDQANLDALCTVREALRWQLDIATADPNEVVRHVRINCRHCHGVNHGYQWKDLAEWMAAYEAIDAANEVLRKAGRKERSLPDDSGGFGFDSSLSPVLTCGQCCGKGEGESIIADTTKLTGKAARLYAGMDVKSGVAVVKLHDQGAAWERVCRILGAFNDKLDIRTPAERRGKTALPEDISADDAARAWLELA